MTIKQKLQATGKALFFALCDLVGSKSSLVAALGVLGDLHANGKPTLASAIMLAGKLVVQASADHGKNATVTTDRTGPLFPAAK
jgi:hypothetical protein